MSDSGKIKKIFEESVDVQNEFLSNRENILSVEGAVGSIVRCLTSGGKVLCFGNGGSAADSQHFAAELVVRFEAERKPLPCISLNTNSSVLTAAANDYSFEDIFSRQIEALACPGDVVFAISTSGTSPNVIKAVRSAKRKDIEVISLTGKGGGELAPLSDFPIIVRSDITARVQEVHIMVIHAICKLVEDAFAK